MRLSILPALLVLAVTSLLASALLVARWFYSGYADYAFLLWNLFLAWLPLLVVLPAPHLRRTPLLLIVVGLVWLLFLPNAPYLLTDLLHLGRGRGAPLWYDLLLLLAFALNGLLLGFASLDVMHSVVSGFFGRTAGWLFAAGCLLLSSLGVYIGRFLRWNSWDALFHPGHLLADLLQLASQPLVHRGAYAFTLFLAALLCFAYLTLRTLPGRAP